MTCRAAEKLNLKARLVPLRSNSMSVTGGGGSEYSVMLPLEIEMPEETETETADKTDKTDKTN